jgi:hypothetical protein
MRFHALLLSFLLAIAAIPARATSYATDASDLWWNASESGWGVNVVQQQEVLFLTFFIYGADHKPTWVYGSNVADAGTSASGGLIYRGDLYRTTGPWFGAPFASITNETVGTVTFTLENVGNATLTYTIDGTTVTKAVTRQTWRNNNLAGSYLGNEIGSYFNCANTSSNGVYETPVALGVTHTNGIVTLTYSFDGTTTGCTFTGPYVQEGRMGSVAGTFSCNGGATGTFTAIEIEASISGIGMRLGSKSSVCEFNGRLGGVRRGS